MTAACVARRGARSGATGGVISHTRRLAARPTHSPWIMGDEALSTSELVGAGGLANDAWGATSRSAAESAAAAARCTTCCFSCCPCRCAACALPAGLLLHSTRIGDLPDACAKGCTLQHGAGQQTGTKLECRAPRHRGGERRWRPELTCWGGMPGAAACCTNCRARGATSNRPNRGAAAAAPAKKSEWRFLGRSAKRE